MKKKIINGIMMVALVAATSTSFVSCKDTNEDVRIEQAAEIAALQGKLKTLENLYGDIDGNRIPALNQKIQDVSDRVDITEADIALLQQEVDELEGWLLEAFTKLVTSVEISGTYNNMLGSINIPGFEPKMLINNYGEAANDVAFPKNADYEGTKIIVGKGEEIGTNADNAGFAGYIYANVNRYVDDVPMLSKAQGGKIFDITIANTAGEDVEGLAVCNVDTENGGPTSDILNWGWTRADNNIYKFVVAYAGEKAKDFVPAKLDLSKFKADLKAVWADRNRYSGTSKESLGHLVADLYYNLATKDYNMKKYGLKFTWEDNTSGEFDDDDTYTYDEETGKIIYNENEEDVKGLKHIVTSEAELVFVTIKPLGFNSGEALATAVSNNVNKFNGLVERAERIENKIFDKIKAQLPNFNPNQIQLIIEKGNLHNGDGVTAPKWWLDVDGDAAWTAGTDVDLTDIIEPLNTNLENVQDMFAKVESMKQKLNASNITNWVEKFTNKFNTLFANNASQMLQPTLLAIDKDGNVNRVSGLKGAPYVADGEITLEPTSYTAELFAPAYAKFLGCKDITADGFNEIIISNEKAITFTPESGKTYEIVYEAVDFFGNTVENTYYIQGK